MAFSTSVNGIGPTTTSHRTLRAVRRTRLQTTSRCVFDSTVVRLGGLEPPTKSLGNSCSFHLSYSRRPEDYNPAPPDPLPALNTGSATPPRSPGASCGP